jgi:hypothetical protein
MKRTPAGPAWGTQALEREDDMSKTICAFDHKAWADYGLANFEDFADRITECNVGEEGDGGGYGEWFFVPDEPLPSGHRVIYFGSWGNDNSPGASTYTHATLFDVNEPGELAEFTLRVQHLESQPEYDDQSDDGGD